MRIRGERGYLCKPESMTSLQPGRSGVVRLLNRYDCKLVVSVPPSHRQGDGGTHNTISQGEAQAALGHHPRPLNCQDNVALLQYTVGRRASFHDFDAGTVSLSRRGQALPSARQARVQSAGQVFWLEPEVGALHLTGREDLREKTLGPGDGDSYTHARGVMVCSGLNAGYLSI